MAWIINTSNQNLDIIIMAMKKMVVFKPGVPQEVDVNTAIDLISRYPSLKDCREPEKYFTERKMRHLVIRDAGIGDLILLEPVLRHMAKQKDVFLASMYPEVHSFNPHLAGNFRTQTKQDMGPLQYDDFDTYDDLRNFSETHNDREATHRTEIYAKKFGLDLQDKEPNLYLSEQERAFRLKKVPGKIYVGIQDDASHDYRQYDRTEELVRALIARGYFVYLFGSSETSIEMEGLVNMKGKTTIREAFSYIKEMDYFIGVDSGLMHVALALHVPTVALFGIITPDLRLKHYTGQRRVIWKELTCRGCGNWHMTVCRHGDKKKDKTFKPPCMDISPDEIIVEMEKMQTTEQRRIDTGKEVKQIFIGKSAKKLTMPIIVYNEEVNLPRFIDLVISHPSIETVIVVDGGSTDNTVEILKKVSKVKVLYVHPYDKNYHEMQAMQRNYSLSFVPDGEPTLIMDIDECFSKDLSDYLEHLANSEIAYGLISRMTFRKYKDIGIPENRIKNYPDWQPRFYRWDRRYKFSGSPHHAMLNAPPPTKIKKDILHFEEEGKDRAALEKTWKEMETNCRRYLK